MYDYSDSFNETISFNSVSSSEKAQEIEDDQEMLMVAKQELNSLELENLVEEKESRKIARQEEIQQKKLAISEMETQLSSSFQKVVDSEKNTNDSIFNSIESVLTPELLLEEDFLSAKYYNDQAQQQYQRASALKQQAALVNDVEQKAELLKEAHQNELAAMENQQDALNLLDEVDVPNPELANNSSITNSNLIDTRPEENRPTNSNIEGDNLAQNPLYNSNQSSAQTLNSFEENSNQIAQNNSISPNETNGSEQTEQQIDSSTPSTSEFSESETNSESGVFTTQVDGQITDVESSSQAASNLNNSSNEQSSSGTTQNLENDQEISEDVALNETFNEGSDKTSNDSNNLTNTSQVSENKDATVLSSTNPAENKLMNVENESTNQGNFSNEPISTMQQQGTTAENQENQLNQPEASTSTTPNVVVEEKEINQTIAGIEFSSTNEPEAYQVAAVVPNIKQPKPEDFSSISSKEILSNNQNEIEQLNAYETELEELNNQLASTENKKEKQKIEKKISNYETKKIEKELKLAEVYQKANENEISISKVKLDVVKKQSEALVSDSYEYKQALSYESAANQLLAEAEEYRAQAQSENDVFKRKELLAKASSAEIVAVEKIETAKKFFSEALIENVSLSSSIDPKQPSINSSSDELSQKASVFSQNAQSNRLKSDELRAQAEKAKSSKRSALLFEAEKLEALANEEKLLSQQLYAKSENIKAYEDYQQEQQQLKDNLSSVDVNETASKEEYRSYYNQQKEIDELSNQLKAVEMEANAYNELFEQQTIKANEFFNKALTETDQQKRDEYIASAQKLKQQASANKQSADEINLEAATLFKEVKKKKIAQAQVISSLDSKSAIAIKTLVLAENKITPLDRKPIDPIEVVSSTFTAPESIKEDIFVVSETTTYSESNPIPVNPPHPEGLIFKVQVGAFRRPIPQDLFKGFAPISAERVRDDITRYRVGYFKNERNANSSKNTIRGLGYSDAFVVAIYNGDRISLSEARNLIENNPSIAAASQSQPLSISSNSNLASQSNTTPTTNSENPTIQQQDLASLPTNQTETSDNTIDNSSITADLENAVAEVNPVENIDGLFYSVQIGAFSKPLDRDNAFNVSPLVTQYRNNLYKYSTGIFNSIDEAQQRKTQMNDLGLLDAFIVAFFNGERVTIARSIELSANLTPIDESIDREDNGVTVLPTNSGIEYYVNLGVFGDSVPKTVSNALLSMKEFRIKPRSIGTFRQYVSGVFSSKEKALVAQQKFKELGISDAEVLEFVNGEMSKGTPKPFKGLFYRVHLGTYYERVPRKLKDVFDRLDYLDVEKVSSNGQEDYYASKKQLHAQLEQVLKDCIDNGVVVAKIVAFKDGVEISVDLAKQLTRE